VRLCVAPRSEIASSFPCLSCRRGKSVTTVGRRVLGPLLLLVVRVYSGVHRSSENWFLLVRCGGFTLLTCVCAVSGVGEIKKTATHATHTSIALGVCVWGGVFDVQSTAVYELSNHTHITTFASECGKRANDPYRSERSSQCHR
jgi:hypothetical protein